MTHKFKTNINCGGCIRSVSGFLNEVEGISWNVDTDVPEKILTVETQNVSSEKIIEVVAEAGFDIEKIG